MQTRSFYSWTDPSELRRVALYPKTAIVSVLPLPLIELSPTLARAITAFAASNLDDILVLVLLFSQVGTTWGKARVIGGQCLGFSLLVLASLLGYFGGQLVPMAWIGLLGLFPISLGVSQLIDNLAAGNDDGDSPSARPGSQNGITVATVAAITVANGGDNIGLYLPLFAHCNLLQLLATLVVFGLMLLLWCSLAWRLQQLPLVASTLNHHGHQVVPIVFIGLGSFILIDSHTLQQRGLACLSLLALGAMVWSLIRQLQQQHVNFGLNLQLNGPSR